MVGNRPVWWGPILSPASLHNSLIFEGIMTNSLLNIPRAFVPRRWQVAALDLWSNSMAGVVQVVTGGGKTAFAALAMKHFMSRFPDGGIVIAVPSVALQDQWLVELTEEFGVAQNEISLLGGGKQKTQRAPISICVMDTLRTKRPNVAENTLLIADECHRFGSPQNAKALLFKHNASLGLSATPIRQYDAGFEEFVEPQLGPVIYTYGYAEASADGILLPFKITNVQVPLLPSERESYDKITRAVAKYDREHRLEKGAISQALRQLLIRRSRVSARAVSRIPVCVAVALKSTFQSIIFHESIGAANQIVTNLRKRGMYAVGYHSQIAPAIRIDNLRLFRRGIAQSLVCCRALDEGLNVPAASLGIIASSTASTRQRIQRLGRVLRVAPGKTFAEVVTLFATEVERERLEREEADLGSVASIAWRRASIDTGRIAI